MILLPNRIIKESICYSDDLDQLSAFEETVFYRLLVRVDDKGRIDARPGFLKSMLFVTKNGVSEKNVSEAVARMALLGLVRLYEVDGKPFLYLPKWHLHQRIRDSKAKYPEPPQGTEGYDSPPQLAATCGEPPPESQSNPNPNPNPLGAQARGGEDNDVLEGFTELSRKAIASWIDYKKERREAYKPTGLTKLLSQAKNQIAKYGDAAFSEAVNSSMAANYQGIVWDWIKNYRPEPQPEMDVTPGMEGYE